MNLNDLMNVIMEKIELAIKEDLPMLKITDIKYGIALDNISKSMKLTEELPFYGQKTPQGPRKSQEESLTELKDNLIGKEYDPLDKTIKNNTFVVVFSAEGCPYCKELERVYMPVIDARGIDVDRIDVGLPEGNAYREEMGVQSWPTVLFVKDSVIKHIEVGYGHSKDEEGVVHITDLINEHLT